MKSVFKKTVVLCALAAMALPAFAEEEKTEARRGGEPFESYGWTAVAFGLATPVQLPWGIKKWDVFGLDLNLAYSDAPKMYGIEVALGGNVARKTMMGMQAALGFNFSNTNAYGIAAALFNMNNENFYGLSVDAVGLNRNVYGVEANLLGSAIEGTMGGLEASGLGNFIAGSLYGVQCAVGMNMARNLNGVQIALYNQTALLWGCQIGLVNYASACDNGLQIGLVNIIMDNQFPVLPFLNWYF